MGKNVLVICSSLRKNSNSEALAAAFAKGARDAGNGVKEITLRGKEIKFCNGCLSCQKTGRCTINDDAADIVGEMRAAQVIAFATPIYYYGISGQLKTLLDRANPLYGSDYRFEDIYLLSAAADDEKDTDSRAVTALEGWIDCFERAKLAGTVFAGGVNEAGDIKGHTSIDRAYKMGRGI